MKIPRRRFLQVAGAAALVARPRASHADAWPNRVVKLEVGFPPGGGMDSASRIVANRLSEILGQQVIIENRPGAGGRIAMDAAAHAAPDGYTVLAAPGAPGVVGLLFDALTFDPANDLDPVSLLGTYPNVIVVPNSSPLKTLAEFIAYAKANPGKVSWASPGIGTYPYLAGELFKRVAGIEMTHVPYRGVAAGGMTDLIAGRLDAMFNTTGSLLQPVRANLVRALAVTSAERSPLVPELPTASEAGVPGFDVTSWYGLYVPAHTAPDIVKKMNAAVQTLLGESDVKQKFADLGVVVQGSTPEQLTAKNTAEVARWTPIIKTAGIRGE
jgi:tripartite-type tricarboxylate transporter receptor subunit TctC